MASREDVLDVMQRLVLDTGQRPSLQAVADAVGLTKQGVLHYFPDRAALDNALISRAVSRVDESMNEAARNGTCARTYLLLSMPTAEDRAVALVLLTSVRTAPQGLPPEVASAMGRWQRLIEQEVGDPVLAEAVRLVGDGLLGESLVTGVAPSRRRIDRLVAVLHGRGGQEGR